MTGDFLLLHGLDRSCIEPCWQIRAHEAQAQEVQAGSALLLALVARGGGTPVSRALQARQAAIEAEAGRCSEAAQSCLKEGPLRAYRLLLEAALRVAKQRGYPARVTQVVFHCPLEVVAVALGVHRVTLWRWLGMLKAEGLLDCRAHKTTCRGQTRNDGTVWALKLVHGGQAARLSAEDLAHRWRDLEGDIGRQRTAYRQTQQSKEGQLGLSGIELILYWALDPQTTSPPLNLNVAPAGSPDVCCVLGLPYTAPSERSRAVEECSKAICAYLGDAHPRFWYWMLWQLLRLREQGQDYFQPLYWMLRRTGADREEGFARKAGALFVQRLKGSFLWDLTRMPQG